jgi:hypothetical protein
MKKNSLILLFIILAATSCSTMEQFRVRLELPVLTEFNLASYENISVANFFLKSEDLDFDPSAELVDYFATEVGQQLKREVNSVEVSLDKQELIEDPEFWKQNSGAKKSSLLITGDVEYNQEIRKALIGKEKKQFDDPFPEQRMLATRKYYTLNMNIYLINAETGETLLKKKYKETQGYDNPNQTAQFAFFDLLHRVREKFFRQVIGGERVQERYLIKLPS